MKNLIPFISLLFILSFASCKKSEVCPTLAPNLLNVSYSEDGKVVFFGFTGSTSYSDIKMEYGVPGYTPGRGAKIDNFQIYDLSEGSYDAYVQLQCNGDTWSDWSQKISFTILDSTKVCFPPSSIYMVDLGCEAKFGWYPNSKGSNADYYQVEYGQSGFTLGTGTVEILANEIEFTDAVLVEGMAYDFYVKANCSASSWSENSAVKSFYATKNYNRCFVPKNVEAYRSGNKIECSFESDGDCEFEYTLITSSQNVGDETIASTTSQSKSVTYSGVNNSSTYHFMVRTVCKDGTKTGWFTKIVIP